MYFARPVIAGFVAVFLAGCAGVPQQEPLPFKGDVVKAGEARVGVAMSKLPKVNTFFPGAGCILCIAAAEAANSSLTKHTQTLTHEELAPLKDQAAAALAKGGVQAQVIAEPIDIAKMKRITAAPGSPDRDFRPLKAKYGVDKLLVIDVTLLGMVRSYAAYIPSSDPKATMEGAAYIVNLSSNTYEWYSPIKIARAADGAWDEPPSFPGLTNAYYQALEIGMDSVLKPLNFDAPAATAAAPELAPEAKPAAAK
jgi:hypothetical protein